MSTNIDSFLKKFRAAVANKSKEIRLSIEEAADLVSANAAANNNYQNLEKEIKALNKKIDALIRSGGHDGMDGGTF